LQCEKPCFNAHKVKRQVMYTKHIIPSYNSCISLSGTLRHTTAVYFALRKRHTTLCMRFSSSTSPFLTPRSTEVTAHAALFYTPRDIILGFSTHIRRTLLATGIASQPPHHPGTNTIWHPTIDSALTDPTIEAPQGHLAWDLPIPDALSPFGEPQSYFKTVSQHALRAYILYIGNTLLNYPSKPSTLVATKPPR
jgi:hypothetical protein